MKIVIFGCDNTGKTTLQEDLKNYFKSKGHDFISVHSPGPIPMLDQISFMNEQLMNDNVIFDRFPIIEETVCGTVLRNHNNFDDVPDLRDIILGRIDLFIFCYPGLSTICKWGDREQMAGVKDNVYDLVLGYHKLFLDLIKKGYNVKEYNFHSDTVDKLLEGVSIN